MKSTKRVFWSIFGICILFWILVYTIGKPVYTAQATVGPPNPSPAITMLSSGASSSLGGLAKRMMGGGGGTTNDTFQEYQNVLQSPRLAEALAKDDHLLQMIYWRQWDTKTQSWKKPGALHAVISGVKTALHRPVHDHPDANQLYLFLQKHLSATQAGSRFALASMSSGYIDATFSYKDREKSEQILGIILDRADAIVRQGLLHDVNSRIDYIEGELKHIQNAEQRDSLISVLTSQEELKVMLVSDKRFATTLISPSYASPKPTSPTPPFRAVLQSLIFSFIIWVGLIYFENKKKFAAKLMYWLSWPMLSRR